MPSTHQMEAVVVGNFYINLLAQMGTDYSTPAVSLLDIATEPHEEKTFASGCKVRGVALRTTIPECLPEQLHYWCLNSLVPTPLLS